MCGGPHGSIVVIETTDSKDRLEGRDPFKLACSVRAVKTEGTPSTVTSLSFSPKFDCLACSFPDNVGLLSMSDVWLKAEQGTPGSDADENTRGVIAGLKSEVRDVNSAERKEKDEVKVETSDAQ